MDFAKHLDPAIAPALAGLEGFDIGSMTLDQIVSARGEMPMTEPEASAVAVRDIVVESADGHAPVPLRVSAPQEVRSNRPCLFWIHGGGYMLGSAFMPEPRIEEWVEQLDCVVVAVEYRLAPEHPYPAPLEDCHRAFQWLVANAAELGIDPRRVAVVGESAGGGLAAAMTMLIRDRGEALPCLQVLMYPMIDDRGETTSSTFVDAPVWSAAANRLGWSAYLGPGRIPGGTNVPDYAAPARAEVLRDLPRTLLCVGQLDIMRDEGIDFAQRLLRAEVPTELHVYPGAPHGFLALAGDADVSRRAASEIDGALRRAFDAPVVDR